MSRPIDAAGFPLSPQAGRGNAHATCWITKRGAAKRKAPGLSAERFPETSLRNASYAVSTVEGSTFTPGPIVEVTAMRWM